MTQVINGSFGFRKSLSFGVSIVESIISKIPKKVVEVAGKVPAEVVTTIKEALPLAVIKAKKETLSDLHKILTSKELTKYSSIVEKTKEPKKARKPKKLKETRGETLLNLHKILTSRELDKYNSQVSDLTLDGLSLVELHSKASALCQINASQSKRQRKGYISSAIFLGEEIQKVRKEKKITTDPIAKELNITTSYISAMEKGKKELTPGYIQALESRGVDVKKVLVNFIIDQEEKLPISETKSAQFQEQNKDDLYYKLFEALEIQKLNNSSIAPLGERIQQARKEKKLSATPFAKELNITTSYISAMENEKRELMPGYIQALESYGVDVTKILTDFIDDYKKEKGDSYCWNYDSFLK